MLRVIFTFIYYCFTCCLLLGSAVSLKAEDGSPDKVVIRIVNVNNSLLQLFELVQDQTSLNFAYDEEDVDLSQSITLAVGEHPLAEFLISISKQTGLLFTQKRSLILVHKRSGVQPLQTTIPVTGIVKDASGAPLEGATVAVKGTTDAVQTKADGSFYIDVPNDAVLVITYSGYRSVEVPVNNRNAIDIVMEPIGTNLNEVVVVGYSSQKKSEITGAVSVVNVGGLSKLPVGNVDQALQGKVSGVRITQASGQPGEGVIVRIRGVGTINDNNPLFIIDGIPTKDGINFLSANDIESISVLKDASSAAIYGARSSNGVIVITTKSGKRGKAQFNYSGYTGVQSHGKLVKMLNTSEYVQIYNEAVDNDNLDITNSSLKRKKIPDDVSMANTDWLESIFRNGMMHSHQLSVTGGNDKTLYYLSGNYFKQDGIILNSGFERYSLRSKLNIDLTDKLSIANSLNISFTKKNIVGSSGDGYGGNGGSIVRYAFFRTPAIPVYDSAGEYSDLPLYPNYFGDGYNPVALASKMDNKELQYRALGNFYIEYKVTRDIILKSDLGMDVIITNNKRFDENYGTNLRVNSPSRLSVSNNTNVNLIWNNTIRYNKRFGGVHSINAIAGSEAIKNKNNIHGGSDRNFPDQLPSLRYLGNGLNITSRSVFEGEQQWALFSLFGNVNYSYKNKYLVSMNVRRDGSSRFAEDFRYGTFFSGSAGWNIHNEDWMLERFPAVSKLRVRGSYGQLGNQDIGNYPWASIIGRGYNYVFGETPASVAGYTVATRGNKNVKWESSTQADIGLDLGLYKDKLNLTVDYFIKNTSDMLIPIPLPLIGGSATTPYVNAGSVENKGLEVELTYANKAGKLYYDISANFAMLNNKVKSLSNGEPIPGGRIDEGIFAALTTVGRPIGSFFLYEMEGIYQNEGEIFGHAYQGNYIRPGDVKFTDINVDGTIDENDRTFLGSAIPKFTYGLTTNLQYANFDLSVFFQGSYGNKLYLQVNHDIEGFYRAFNLTKRVYDERWTGEGTSNSMPRVSWLGSTNNKTPSSRFLEDASYVRLKNAQLGYSIPARIIERWSMKSIRIYFTGQNLLTITKYSGLDPEMHTSDNLNSEKYRGDVAAGIDWGTYPTARSFIVGVNVGF
jgi:TonB-dependent starch-binding outer membrane protein SusC